MEKNSKINIGIIGLGVMGKNHVRVCNELSNFEILGVADIKQEAVDEIKSKYQVKAFLDYKELLEMPGLDAVVVATSDQFHREPCELAAEKKLSIFLEKPIATSVEDGEAIIEVAKKNDVKLMVGHTLRYDPRYIAVKQAAEENKFGDYVHFFARRNATTWSGKRVQGRAEVVVFQGVHDIDFLEWMTGDKIVRVCAESVTKSMTDLGVADTIVATLKFSNGAVGLLEQSWGLPYGVPWMLDAQLEVVGTKGAMYIDTRAPAISQFLDNKYAQPEVILGLPGSHYLQDEYSWFYDYLAGEKEASASGEEALSALRVAKAIVESMNQKTCVDIY